MVEKILFVAGYIEPGRDFVNLKYVKELAYINLDEAVFAISFLTIKSLKQRKFKIYPTTIKCRDFYAKELGKGRIEEIMAALRE